MKSEKNPQFESFCAHAGSVRQIPITRWWGTGASPRGLVYVWLNQPYYVAVIAGPRGTQYAARVGGQSCLAVGLHEVERWLFEKVSGQKLAPEKPEEPTYALPSESLARVLDPELEHGTYPQDKYRYRTLMRLCEAQVSLLAEEDTLFRDLNNAPTYEFTSRWLREALVNKGYLRLPSPDDLAIYNHDGTLYLIQILGARDEAK